MAEYTLDQALEHMARYKAECVEISTRCDGLVGEIAVARRAQELAVAEQQAKVAEALQERDTAISRTKTDAKALIDKAVQAAAEEVEHVRLQMRLADELHSRLINDAEERAKTAEDRASERVARIVEEATDAAEKMSVLAREQASLAAMYRAVLEQVQKVGTELTNMATKALQQ